MKFINESLNDFLKPKSQDQILADILETDVKNIPLIMKIYEKWRSIFLDDTKKNRDKISAIYNDMSKYNFNQFAKGESVGLAGLQRDLMKWYDGIYDDYITYEHIDEFIFSIHDAIKEIKNKKVNENLLKGGKGDKLTKSDVNQREYLIGIKVEREHSYDFKKINEIVLDHLAEDPKYYSKLIEKGIVDEENAINQYIKFFGTKKLPSKYKKMYEGLKDILKPKSKEQIDEDIEKLSANELYALYDTTNDEHYVEKAIDKNIAPHIISDDLLNLYEFIPKEKLIPYIIYNIKEYYDLNITKNADSYYLSFDDYDKFIYCFNNSDYDIIKNIFNGNSYEIFENRIEDLNIYKDFIKKHNDILDFNLIKKYVPSNINNFYDAFIYILDNENDQPLTNAFINTFSELQTLADENEAYNRLNQSIIKAFDLKIELKNNEFNSIISIKNIYKLFELIYDITNKLNPNLDNIYGDLDDTVQNFNETLESKLIDEGFELNESLKDILKPKNGDEIKQAFNDLTVYEKVNFLQDKDRSITNIIDFEQWPLIMQVQRLLKNNEKFSNIYRCTYIDVFKDSLNSGARFRIFERFENNLNGIMIEQYDEFNFLYCHKDKFTNAEKIVSYEDFLNWMNDEFNIEL